MKVWFIGSLIALAFAVVGCSNNTVSRSLVHRSAVGALGPYSGSVTSDNLVFVSGKIGKRGGSFAVEVNTAIDAVEEELARSGVTLADAISVTVYLTDLELYGEFNSIYASRFHQPYPARACVEVSRLPGEARVEIQVIAKSQ
ncbi:MAG: RidA family protein [Planctomycetes bacterium]|nr:RidA family protein [Planctomycetota bacterium]